MRGLLSAAGAGRQCAPRGAHPGLLGGPSTSPLEGSMVLVARFRSVAPLRRSSLFEALCLASAVALGDPTFERCPDSAARITWTLRVSLRLTGMSFGSPTCRKR